MKYIGECTDSKLNSMREVGIKIRKNDFDANSDDCSKNPYWNLRYINGTADFMGYQNKCRFYMDEIL